MRTAMPEEDADDRRARERLCVATRQVLPVERLIRFVPSPDGVLTPDLKRKLPGRGVWVTATRAAFDEAIRRKAFARSLKQPVTVPAGLPLSIETMLERACLDMLSLANKAGLAFAGHAKVMEKIAARRTCAVFQAPEGANDGARKVAAAIRTAYMGVEEPPIIAIFSSAQLDLALGRANVIHAALGAGPASTGFLERVAALAFWRDGGLPLAGLLGVGEPPPGAGDEPLRQASQPETAADIEFLDVNRGDP